MNKNYTFADVSVGDMFVTGPAETLFVKVSDTEGAPAIQGGLAIAIEDGGKVWTPANRIVNRPEMRHFVRAGRRYLFEQSCKETREKESYRLMVEASKY